MNKKQKWLTLISVLIFLFVTLNPLVFHIMTSGSRARIYFTSYPIYQYWAVIAVPFFALFYYFNDEDKKDNKPKDEQKQ
jgi:hypothetical protein